MASPQDHSDCTSLYTIPVWLAVVNGHIQAMIARFLVGGWFQPGRIGCLDLAAILKFRLNVSLAMKKH
jgi:hypothetical protein